MEREKPKKSLNVLGFDKVHTIQEVVWVRGEDPEPWLVDEFSTDGNGTTFRMYRMEQGEDRDYYLAEDKAYDFKWNDIFSMSTVEREVYLSDFQ